MAGARSSSPRLPSGWVWWVCPDCGKEVMRYEQGLNHPEACQTCLAARCPERVFDPALSPSGGWRTCVLEPTHTGRCSPVAPARSVPSAVGEDPAA